MPIAVDIDVMLARRKMSVGELADRVGVTPAKLAVLKNGRAKAVRFATLVLRIARWNRMSCRASQCGGLARGERPSAYEAPTESRNVTDQGRGTPLLSASRSTATAWATAARVAWVSLRGLSIMKSWVIPS